MHFLLMSLVLSLGHYAQADPLGSVEELSRYFRAQLNKADVFAAKAPAPSSSPAFPLQDINIDIAPQVTFGLNGFISLTVAPEIDFVLVPDSINP